MLTAVDRGVKISELLHWHSKGLSQRDVAEKIGLSQRWVCAMLARLGLPPNGHRSDRSRRKKSEAASEYFRVRRFREAISSIEANSWEAAFPLTRGAVGPRYGYFLFSALTRLGAIGHGEPGIQILPRNSSILVRANHDRLREIVAAIPAGTILRVSDARCEVGAPRLRPISQRSDVRSWCVTMKGYTEADALASRLKDEMRRIGLASRLRLTIGDRQVIKIKGKVIVGFGATVSGLNPRESMLIQSIGLGGRRRFGCGVFVPC